MGNTRCRRVPVQIKRRLVDIDLAEVASVEPVSSDCCLSGCSINGNPRDSRAVGSPRWLRIDRAWIGEFGDLGAVGKHRGELEVEVLDDKSAIIRVLFWGRFLFLGAEVGVGVS